MERTAVAVPAPWWLREVAV